MRALLTSSGLVALLISACMGKEPSAHAPAPGPWRMEFDLNNGSELPFTFDLLKGAAGSWSLLVHNSEENIVVEDVALRGDTLRVRMPLFDSEFVGVLSSDSSMTGFWNNYLKGPDYRIAFRATAGKADRFAADGAASADVSGQWRAAFSGGTPDAYNAIGLFQQETNGTVSGTFMTETGDYRYLAGAMRGDSLLLSCFDGSHAFLFKAELKRDTLFGRFFSGVHWQEPWFAVRDASYKLRDPDSLTTLREGYGMVDFRFPDTEGRMVSSADANFRGKPLMVQVMGSWCPNCVDEARLLNEVYSKYHERGLEVLAIAFEKYEDPAKAAIALKKFKKALGVPYPILYGGTASKEEAGNKLPFLDHLMSYPTCIFIDRNGVVRRIRTGFYGPGTGEHYDHYKRNLDVFIEQLLSEEVVATAPQ